MLKSVEYTVTFGTTGRTMSEKINFQAGFGTITGPNESGKSFVIEMVRYAMFGTAALRGKISEYKKARVKLVVDIKGETYTIERSPSNAKVFRDDAEIAVGTTPVNAKVVQLLGFGLAVFDTSCVANQGDLEALGNMKPTERKRLVDSVIGLGVIDDLAKSAGEEAKANRRLASDLSDSAKEPQEPVRPEGYRPMGQIEADLSDMSEAKERLAVIKDKMKPLTPPTVPQETVAIPSDILEGYANDIEQTKAAIRRAEVELSTLPQPSPHTVEELDQMVLMIGSYDLWQSRQTLERIFPKYTLEQIEAMLTQHEENELAIRAGHVRSKIADLKTHGTHTCPACSHEWDVEAGSIHQLEDELSQIDWAQSKVVPESRASLSRHRDMLDNWDQEAWDKVKDAEQVEKPELTTSQIENEMSKHAFAARRGELIEQIANLKAAIEDKPDYARMLKDRLSYEQALEGHAARMLEYQTKVQEQEALLAEQALLLAEVEGYEALSQLKTEVAIYEALRERHAVEMTHYVETMANVAGISEEADHWDKAREALTTLRGLVKQHLMPSLNKVASYYLSQMTDGQRQVIYTDEDFNITVDGQPLNTLSGSGKAVACLALRLGLGQVLTNNILSLFVGDEIDASMDENRANSTAFTLQTLKSRVSQILLVTHKFPTADYYITVGRGHELKDTHA